MSDPILHEDPRSGNCYKIKLTAALLGLPLATRQYDILAGETRTPEFLANVNPNGRIPVLEIDARFLPESNAACWYLAGDSALIPRDRFTQAEMLRWWLTLAARPAQPTTVAMLGSSATPPGNEYSLVFGWEMTTTVLLRPLPVPWRLGFGVNT